MRCHEDFATEAREEIMNGHKMVASNLCEALKSLTGATESCESVNFSPPDALFQIANHDKAVESRLTLTKASPKTSEPCSPYTWCN